MSARYPIRNMGNYSYGFVVVGVGCWGVLCLGVSRVRSPVCCTGEGYLAWVRRLAGMAARMRRWRMMSARVRPIGSAHSVATVQPVRSIHSSAATRRTCSAVQTCLGISSCTLCTLPLLSILDKYLDLPPSRLQRRRRVLNLRHGTRMSPADLTTARTSLNLSFDELASRLGVSSRTVRRWEDGTRAIPPLLVLAIAHLTCKPRRTTVRLS